jgi:RNA-binding protein
MNLSEAQKKHLRGLGHTLKPVVMIGGAGLSQAVSDEFESALEHHELVKISVRVGDRKLRDQVIGQLCAQSRAQLVQRVGNMALLYRPNPKNPRIRLPAA